MLLQPCSSPLCRSSSSVTSIITGSLQGSQQPPQDSLASSDPVLTWAMLLSKPCLGPRLQYTSEASMLSWAKLTREGQHQKRTLASRMLMTPL